MNPHRVWSYLRRLALALLVAVPLAAVAAPQETFATPEAAVDALMAALKADSDPAMIAIFGETHKDLVVNSDKAASSATRPPGIPRRALEAEVEHGTRARGIRQLHLEGSGGPRDVDSDRADLLLGAVVGEPGLTQVEQRLRRHDASSSPLSS